ncbi:helix-turn-helix domain-containing protein [Streptomyces phyllanthi]|uniref:Helix-turn-helix domain-containing protein n=1 Tax=Streptomyces phyllanthi TaxID=1803180 RepID=A0A5N8W5L5_9ACTN|nr:XRE family transcriptional regulator [Streptomyces phyllanthi]MPY41638.1 helix-turn-helix domain-containing protein [Streptomyces phyllanthi]
MAISGGPDPAEARTSAEYVALLRGLKERSGLTYRQLEQRAAERDDVLARSTVADMLRRDTLPRAEVVAALVRACGAEEDVPRWLETRERLASADPEAAEAPEADGGEPDTDGHGGGDAASAHSDGTAPDGPPGQRAVTVGGGRVRTASLVALASLGTVVLLVIGVLVLLPQDGDTPTAGEAGGKATLNGAAASVGPGPSPGVSRVRPARANGLCLTDGDVRVDGESKLLAVQRPCEQAVPPTTTLLRADDGLYRVRWDHPQHGPGCLTVLPGGPFRSMLEPWTDCEAGDSQRFRIEKADGKGRWRLRSALDDGQCVTIRGGADEVGAVAVMKKCAGRDDADQVFLIGPG